MSTPEEQEELREAIRREQERQEQERQERDQNGK